MPSIIAQNVASTGGSRIAVLKAATLILSTRTNFDPHGVGSTSLFPPLNTEVDEDLDAAKFDLNIEAGAQFYWPVLWTDKTGVGHNLANHHGLLYAAPTRNALASARVLHIESPDEITFDSVGNIVITKPADKTVLLDFRKAVYDFIVFEENGALISVGGSYTQATFNISTKTITADGGTPYAVFADNDWVMVNGTTTHNGIYKVLTATNTVLTIEGDFRGGSTTVESSVTIQPLDNDTATRVLAGNVFLSKEV